MTTFTFRNLVVYKATKEFKLSFSKEEIIALLIGEDFPGVKAMTDEELAEAYCTLILHSGGSLEEWGAEENYCDFEDDNPTPIKFDIEE